MNITILDSWLREYLTTKATPQKIAEIMSLTSVSIERLEPYKNDMLYDIEVTTNRPDLMSVVGLAREAAAVLPQFGIEASFNRPKLQKPPEPKDTLPIIIKSNDRLLNRTCAVIMEVKVHESPKEITERLETTNIRSLNNTIDITNYVMRVIGHPTHVFDYDKLKTRTLVVRESRKNEKITTLDGKTHTLLGGDVVADDGLGNIIDLLGVMGLENSVVDKNTKRILFFIDNLDPHKIRNTSMALGIRTEAAQLNEKGVDPELAMDALLYGISLYKKYADASLLSPLIDIYHHTPSSQIITVEHRRITTMLGVDISLKNAADILKNLGFAVEMHKEALSVTVPSIRQHDITIAEDVIEEVARVYGYHNIPSILPPITTTETVSLEENPQYWEQRVKQALKYWGMTEVYTYPMVSEHLYEGPLDKAVTLQNPLGEEFTYMRRTLVPSLLKIVRENKKEDTLQIFEIANTYEKVAKDLPRQELKLAGVIKKLPVSFFEVKGLIEQLCEDLGIKNLMFTSQGGNGMETEIILDDMLLGSIEILDEDLINFELSFTALIHKATLQKSYHPLSKFPPVIEDLSFKIDEKVATGDIISLIKKQHTLITEVSLIDRYEDSRTFHILYQDPDKNLTTEEVSEIRRSIIKAVKKQYHATLK